MIIKLKAVACLLFTGSLLIVGCVAPPSPGPSPAPKTTTKPAYQTGSYGACSVTCGGGVQSRSVSCANGANGCSGTKPSSTRQCNTQACVCNPCKTVNIDNTTAAHWSVPTNATGYTKLKLKANVGDSIVFKYSSSHDVYKLATKWHYDECNFEDAVLLGSNGDGSGNGYKYTVAGSDDRRRIYFACSVNSHCALGQKASVKVGDFEHATLKSATDRIEKSLLYDFNSIEAIWCFEEHCPASAMTYYDNDEKKSEKMCEADAQNLLGFVYRKKKNPNFQRSEKYYRKALELVPDHCGARSYLGELYVQTNNKTFATKTLNKLILDCGLQSSEAKSLLSVWEEKGWCGDMPSDIAKDQVKVCEPKLGTGRGENKYATSSTTLMNIFMLCFINMIISG